MILGRGYGSLRTNINDEHHRYGGTHSLHSRGRSKMIPDHSILDSNRGQGRGWPLQQCLFLHGLSLLLFHSQNDITGRKEEGFCFSLSQCSRRLTSLSEDDQPTSLVVGRGQGNWKQAVITRRPRASRGQHSNTCMALSSSFCLTHRVQCSMKGQKRRRIVVVVVVVRLTFCVILESQTT